MLHYKCYDDYQWINFLKLSVLTLTSVDNVNLKLYLPLRSYSFTYICILQIIQTIGNYEGKSYINLMKVESDNVCQNTEKIFLIKYNSMISFTKIKH